MVVVVAVRGDRVWVVLDRHRDLEASLGEAKRQPTRAGEEIGDAQVSDACAQLSPIGSLYSPPDFSTRGREDSGPSPLPPPSASTTDALPRLAGGQLFDRSTRDVPSLKESLGSARVCPSCTPRTSTAPRVSTEISSVSSHQFPGAGRPERVELSLGASRLAVTDNSALTADSLPSPVAGLPPGHVDQATKGVRGRDPPPERYISVRRDRGFAAQRSTVG